MLHSSFSEKLSSLSQPNCLQRCVCVCGCCLFVLSARFATSVTFANVDCCMLARASVFVVLQVCVMTNGCVQLVVKLSLLDSSSSLGVLPWIESRKL